MSQRSPQFRWIVSQIGRREHYAPAVSLQRRGALRLFYADAWCSRFRSFVRKLPGPFPAFSERFHPELPRDKVVSFSRATILDSLRKSRHTAEDQYLHHARVSARFAARVAKHLRRLRLSEQPHAFFAFTSAACESLAVAKDRGMVTVLDQIDPARVEEDMVAEEMQRWPGWETCPGRIPELFWQRVSDEWRRSDIVLVNSQFSRRALIRQGVPREKLVVVPLAYEPPIAPGGAAPSRPATAPHTPLRVLWLGQVVLRKGIPYLFEAARLLKDSRITFTVAGPVFISEAAAATAPPNVRLIGRVTGTQAAELYRSHDVFVLPTISDGFAITQLEAMSHGLPVITTPNCGDVVNHTHDGFVVPIRDPIALAAAIHVLDEDRSLLAAMSAAAQVTAGKFSMDRYALALENAARRAVAPAPTLESLPSLEESEVNTAPALRPIPARKRVRSSTADRA